MHRRPLRSPRRAPAAGCPAASTPRASEHAVKIHAVVRAIPRGRVATYGEVAALAGITSGHRIAARIMKSCPQALPWQRVLGKKDARRGQINIDEPDHAALQRVLLESEGIVFDDNGFIPLLRYGWLSAPSGKARARAKVPPSRTGPSKTGPSRTRPARTRPARKAARAAKRAPVGSRRQRA
jgi:methylated-DNA-protein-cysteine methyltransferase-like protein